MFNNCENLIDVIIPSGITGIRKNAFSNTSISSITIPTNVTELDEVFTNCNSLTEVFFSGNRTDALSLFKTFYGCTSISSFTATGFSYSGNVLNVLNDTFGGCTNLKSVELAARRIGKRVFQGCTSLTSITLTLTPASIDDDFINGCTNLTATTLPNPEQGYSICCLNGSSLQRVQFGTEVKSRSGVYDDLNFKNDIIGEGRYFGVGCTELSRIDILVGGNFTYKGSQTIPDNFFSTDLPANGVVYYYHKSLQEPEITSYTAASKFVEKLGNGWTLVDGGVYDTE